MAERKTSPENFVKVWQSSNSLDEVASILGLARNTCDVKAQSFIRNGVPLKRLTRPYAKPDYKKLAKLARKFKKRNQSREL